MVNGKTKKLIGMSIGAGVLSLLGVMLWLNWTKDEINIYYYILRDRIIVMDQVRMKKNLYVGYRLKNRKESLEGIRTVGKLFFNGTLVSEVTSTNKFETAFRSGNIAFDLPYEIEDGLYTIQINIFKGKGEFLAKGETQVKRKDLKSSFSPRVQEKESQREEISYQKSVGDIQITKKDESLGYVITARSPLEYVFNDSRPQNTERINQLCIKAVKNEFEPVTFSLFALRDLGNVRIKIDELRGKKGIIRKGKIKVGVIETVEESYGLPEGKYATVPTLIRPGNKVRIEKGQSQRFWITIRIDENVKEGDYYGNILIEPEKGVKKSIPLKVTVFPIVLEDIPEVDYFMLMTYEFTELTNPWGKKEKEEIYEGGCKILRNYREHGMTTLCYHSPFILMTHEDGKPNLDDIFAGLKAAKETGFQRPIIWYLGHLIQTSKPRHPGNIVGFDKEIHLNRLDYLMKEVSQMVKENDLPDIIFLPIDEPDDSSQDYKNRRKEMTPLFLKTIAGSHSKTMLTIGRHNEFSPVDYLCSGEYNADDKKIAQSEGKKYLLYNNCVPTHYGNPVYARYFYGYYVWKNGLNGMATWTFQNTQNASGAPTLADTTGNDVFLAYPNSNGPLNTVKWEAIREGIDDHKLVYQLEKRIRRLKELGIISSAYEKYLNEIRGEREEPSCEAEAKGEWDPSYFKKTRETIISLILEIDKSLKNARKLPKE